MSVFREFIVGFGVRIRVIGIGIGRKGWFSGVRGIRTAGVSF